MTLVADGESRLHLRSWGADYMHAGEVRFRLWSPSSRQISLQLENATTPMTRQEDGWFEVLATGVVPGSAYNYLLPDGQRIPDPAARAQRNDVHGPSLVVNPTAYGWQDESWRGRPWEEAVIYELHIGTFTPEGTFRSAMAKLDYLADLGMTAIEIMPVAQFAGDRGWGYDGVLIYAPHRVYGSPDDMKTFVDAAHRKGLMVFLDVVYNHFGPAGNYLPLLASEFFDRRRSTPWGAAIAYERRAVRDFFIENALYWLEEFHLDGLRFDAIDQIRDQSSPEILEEIASRVRQQIVNRPIHLITEDNRNVTHLHARDAAGEVRGFTAEWNDDFHTAAHVFATGELAGYFSDFREAPLAKLARTLTEGFAYQGEPSDHHGGEPRGEPSRHLPPSAFVNFLQNHDQVGNRAFGERLALLADPALVQCLTAILILSPGTPLLFMGEEWGETRPFQFFTDFEEELAEAVKTGRRREFAAFLRDDQDIPDPNDIATFEASKLDWSIIHQEPHTRRLSYLRHLLRLRQLHLVPLFAAMRSSCGNIRASQNGDLAVDWVAGNRTLGLRANLSNTVRACPPSKGQVVFLGPAVDARYADDGGLSPMSVLLTLEEASNGKSA